MFGGVIAIKIEWKQQNNNDCVNDCVNAYERKLVKPIFQTFWTMYRKKLCSSVVSL